MVEHAEQDNELSSESIKAIAESVGVRDLNGDCTAYLAKQALLQARTILRDALKYKVMTHSVELTTEHMERANRRPVPIYAAAGHKPRKYCMATSRGREIYGPQDEEVDLDTILSAPPPKVPQDVQVKVHWLTIEGSTPTIPDNPPMEDDKLVIDAPVVSIDNVEAVNSVAPHEISREQQLYFKELTTKCISNEKQVRDEAVHSLSTDPGLAAVLPRLTVFIIEGIRVGLGDCKMYYIQYMLEMLDNLLQNKAIRLEKFLHDIIPSVISCMVCTQICGRPLEQDHWSVRGFASRILAGLVRSHNLGTNQIQSRVIKMLHHALDKQNSGLVSTFGVLAGLCELGSLTISTIVLPEIRNIYRRVELKCATSQDPIDRHAKERIKELLVRKCAHVVQEHLPELLSVDDYEQKFGDIGREMFYKVMRPTSHMPMMK